ncbi:M48 family metallopeptidase [Halopiger xanaduensis]|uniref:Peptidase M48 Ste24p n=1 Tax=Halopiger xanaduensis (strain DSM 18323 / JCM 14033 / SH-6) TaxID=797210 RepID=F8D5J0_HALXS|nr:M48 family metalloprotease [Halopiger xanaduensis]AEH38826.1 peptidase M48 Ste24p [Halopiger xanaduensis SH-6]
MSATRTAPRALLVLVGFAVLCCYAGLAALSYLGLATLWLSAPDPATTLAIVVGVGLVVGYLSYRFGRTQLLSQLEAVELPRSRAPTLYRRLDGLADRMDVEPPTVMIAQLPTPNAFALGSATGGVIVLDRSLFRLLSLEELEALVAHELAHLEGYDAFVQTLAYSVFRTIAGLAVVGLLPALLLIGGLARSIAWMRGRPQAWPETVFGRVVRWAERGVAVALLAVTALVRAHSRRREFAADDRAANVTGNPLALARALRRIQRVADTRRGLLSPLYVHADEREDAWSRLFSTHPSTDDRVERLADRARRSSGTRNRIEIQ